MGESVLLKTAKDFLSTRCVDGSWCNTAAAPNDFVTALMDKLNCLGVTWLKAHRRPSGHVKVVPIRLNPVKIELRVGFDEMIVRPDLFAAEKTLSLRTVQRVAEMLRQLTCIGLSPLFVTRITLRLPSFSTIFPTLATDMAPGILVSLYSDSTGREKRSLAG